MDVLQPGAVFHGVLLLQHDGVAGALHQLLVKVGQLHLAGELPQLRHQLGELGQAGGGLLKLRPVPGVAHHVPQGAALRLGDGLGPLHGGGPDAPGRVVDDAGQAQIVVGVVDGAEVGHHVLDLRPVEEADAPDDAVGDAVALEGLLKLVGLGVHAVEHRVIPPAPARGEAGQDLGGHELGLVVLVHGGVAVNLVPRLVLRPQLLALAALIVADDRVGRLQDVFGGAVVLLQPDHPRPLVLGLEGEDVLDGGPPEAVDGLVVVAHHADVLVPPRQGGGQQILEVVGVLVLVNEYIAEFFLVILPNVIKILEQADGVQDDVVEIQGVGLPEAALILGVDLGDFHQPVVPRLLTLLKVVLPQLHGVLGPGNIAQDGAGGEGLLVQVEVLHNVLDHPLGVGGVVDGEGTGEAQPVDVPPQDAHAGGVEGGGPDVVGRRPQHPLQPLLQLPGGLVGEGDGDDGPGDRRVYPAQPLLLRLLGGIGVLDVALQKGQVCGGGPGGRLIAVRPAAILHQVGDAVNEHGGLAAARPRQQQQRPIGGQCGPPLLRVQVLVVQGDSRPPRFAEAQFLFSVQHGFLLGNGGAAPGWTALVSIPLL